MMEGKRLLLLAALVLVTSQQKPQVVMVPPLNQVYSGDLFYLSCDSSRGGNTAKWFFNEAQSAQTSTTWKFAVAAAKHSGFYHCERGGVKSDRVNISVLEFIPRASLILKTGQPVMRVGGSVNLQIDNEDGLYQSKWRCFVHKGGETKRIMLRLERDTVSLCFQSSNLTQPENIFWCTDKEQRQRSNQIVVRTSGKRVSLEMYPVPVMAGESVTVRCLVWGAGQISRAVFYVNSSVKTEDKGPIFEIPKVTENEKGTYKCNATFTYPARTGGLPHVADSDVEYLYVYEIPMRAELSQDGRSDLSCSCSRCPEGAHYRWYKVDGDALPLISNGFRSLRPPSNGIYSCRAVWEEGRSLLSRSYTYEHHGLPVYIIVIVLVVPGVLCVAVGVFFCRRRQATVEIYEDVGLNKLDSQYEPLQRPAGTGREGEYDTLHAGATGKKEGEHPPEELQGRAGGYEALTRKGRKEEVYHTLGEEGPGSGGGGYEALRREEKAVEIYHTLELAGAATARGGQDDKK